MAGSSINQSDRIHVIALRKRRSSGSPLVRRCLRVPSSAVNRGGDFESSTAVHCIFV